MAINDVYSETVNALIKGMDGYMTTRSVVGEPITIGDTIIIPLVNVTFGMAAGSMAGKESSKANQNTGGGLGGKMTPCAVIVVKNESARVINIASNTGIEKLIDMIPDFVANFKVKNMEIDPKAKAAAVDAMEEMLDKSVSKVQFEE